MSIKLSELSIQSKFSKGLSLLIEGRLIELYLAVVRVVGRLLPKPKIVKRTKIITSTALNSNQPLVSVVIPCFNYGQFVAAAIDSILLQTLPNIEIIVVDGGSTDGTTIEILKNIQRPKTRIFFREGRHYVGSNRNYGISIATGRYICCLDADDTLDCTYIEKAAFYLETYGYDIVSTAINFVGAKQGKLDILQFPDLTDMAIGNHVLTCAVFRKSFWLNFNGYIDTGIGQDHVAEDWDFWLRLCGNGARIRNISTEHLFNYRIHNGASLSNNVEVKPIEQQKNAILLRNKTLLTSKRLRNSARLKHTRIRCDPIQTALTISVRGTANTKINTLILALPYIIVGGAERLLSGLCSYLVTKNWRIIVVTTMDQDSSFGNSIDWFKAATSEVYVLQNFLKNDERIDFLDYLIESRKPKYILNAGSTLIYEQLPRIKRKYPTICSVDLLFNLLGHTQSHAKYKKFIDFALAENQEVYDWYQNTAGWRTNQIRKLSSGVDLKKLRPSIRPNHLVEKYSVSEDSLVIGYSGRLSFEKSPDLFVEIANLSINISNVCFIMTGVGPMHDEICKLIAKLPKTVKFIYAGLVDNVDEYLALYDILILPSRTDGRPLVVMEALACGVPVIASNIGALPDLIEDGINGYLLQAIDTQGFADCIAHLVDDKLLLNKLKVGARASAEHRLDSQLAYQNYETALIDAIQCV
jgi:glycosyltransferase involved in cell wall biosynthesis